MDKEEIPKKNNSNDLEADFQILDDFERFDQKNDVFRRAWWDDSIKNKKTSNQEDEDQANLGDFK